MADVFIYQNPSSPIKGIFPSLPEYLSAVTTGYPYNIVSEGTSNYGVVNFDEIENNTFTDGSTLVNGIFTAGSTMSVYINYDVNSYNNSLIAGYNVFLFPSYSKSYYNVSLPTATGIFPIFTYGNVSNISNVFQMKKGDKLSLKAVAVSTGGQVAPGDVGYKSSSRFSIFKLK